MCCPLSTYKNNISVYNDSIDIDKDTDGDQKLENLDGDGVWTPKDFEKGINVDENAELAFIPDHAQSVICELHMIPNKNEKTDVNETGKVLITTKANYQKYTTSVNDVDFKLYSKIDATTATIQTKNFDVSSKFVTKLKDDEYSVTQFELPLYRD